MKKLKKILSLMACAVMVMISCVSLTACSKEEVAENTETVIETSSSIIPVELSKETAQGIYTSALENLLNSKAYEYKFTGKQGEQNIATATVVGALSSSGQRYVYEKAKNSFTEDEICMGYYGGKYCTLNLKTKEYNEDSTHKGMIIGQQADGAFGIMLTTIASGRYYNGYYYVSGQYDTADTTDFVEIMIKDNMIMKAHFVSSEDNKIYQYAQYEFNYTNIDTSKVVMSLDGFTKAN